MSSSVLIRVQETIAKIGLSDQEIADVLQVTKTTVWRWRTGKTTNFAPKLLHKISEKLHIDYEWLRHGHKQQIYTNSVNNEYANENEMVYYLRKTVNKQQQKIMTLQEHLIDSKNDLVVSQKELIVCNKERTNIIQKYNSLKESMLSKNIYNIFTDSTFFKEIKKKLNYIPSDTTLSLIFAYLFL